jgi:hypothetical protein
MRSGKLNGWRARFFLHSCIDRPGVKELAGQVIFQACALLYVGR